MQSTDSSRSNFSVIRSSFFPAISAFAFAFACSTSGTDDSIQGGINNPGVGGDTTSSGGGPAAASGGTGVGGASSAGVGGAGVGVIGVDDSGGAPSGGAPAETGGATSGGAPADTGGVTGNTGGDGSGGSGSGGDSSGGTSNTSGGLVPGTDNYNCDAPSGDMPELQLTPYVTTGLDLPIYITHAPNETDRFFVLEQAGKIQIVKNGTVNSTPFLDMVGSVSIDPWEQGLLGLAFHPDYATNGLFYIHYNDSNQANVVAEYKVSSADPDVADPASARIVLTVDTDRTGQYQGYHNGGSIFLGMQGELFIALGDGAGRGPGEATSNSQDVSTLRGTLSRINPEASGSDPYTIPAGNMAETTAMVDGKAVSPEIWDYGLRNPYRTNMDACTGDIYFGDVGHFDYEEVDVEPSGKGHHNYGWPILEGDTCLLDPNCTEPANYRKPVVAYGHNSAGSGAVIGGSVYRGSAIPALRGTYFFSDLYGGTRVFRYDSTTDTITINGNGSVEEQTNPGQSQQTIVSIQNGGDGELYFVGRGGSTEPDGPSVSNSVIYKLEVYIP